MSRILSIDYGTKKVGFALSDEDRKVAFPKDVRENIWDYLIDYIKELIVAEDITEIVIGLPKNLDGTENDITREVRQFSKKLQEFITLPLHFEDERFTSKAVESSGGAPYHKADASAAALILQSFLDRNRKTKELE